MNANFFVAEDEVFNPNKVLTRKGMDAFIGDRGIKSYAGVLKKDNKLFYNFIRVKVAEGKNCVEVTHAPDAEDLFTCSKCGEEVAAINV